MKLIMTVLLLMAALPELNADWPTGVWLRRSVKNDGTVRLTVEPAGTGRKLSYETRYADGTVRTVAVVTLGDGKEAPVTLDGKASGQSWAMRFLDVAHNLCIVRLDGKHVSTQKSELSEDGKVIKVETIAVGRPAREAIIDYWDMQ